ncbi:hypothetical protein WH52_12630 [Tenacibaculum holothuriorum]|uniref:Uncharacterized protein n=1 Tax=Tenacibaculum holothuriorum TaxID=1635173 RepID=A0A1Y2PBH9_9FLAO|nr:hypothetical protein [Tenacibaculum holothuriorum]OSY87109.1 hypothetical protein WH52_12630 [Tenacibaculum holothuriorum]
MPANPKYLTQSNSQKLAKLSAGIFGGYIVSALLHICLVVWLPNSKEILITIIYTHFIIWGLLLIIPYLFDNGWKAWGIYILSAILLFTIYQFGNQQNPFV